MQHVLTSRILAPTLLRSPLTTLSSCRATPLRKFKWPRLSPSIPRAGIAYWRISENNSASPADVEENAAALKVEETVEDESNMVPMRPLVPVRKQSPLEELFYEPKLNIRRTGQPRPKKLHHLRANLLHQYEQMKASETTKKIPRWEPPPELIFGDAEIQSLPLPILYDALQQLADWGHLDASYNLAHGLLTVRGEPPTYKMYHALICANASESGSADHVIHLLEELTDEAITLDQTLCSAILRVLAVHPDYILRAEILQHMERRWFGLSGMGHHMIVAGMFREMQLERAIQELQTMKSNDLKIEPWLYTLGISVLVEAGEFDEAMRVMRLRLEDVGNTHVTALWTFLLDSAAEAHHYITCRYIWIRCVKADYINVSSGTCLHLLNIAARQGDVDFAQDIVRVIKRDHLYMTEQHWEMLIETYANANELRLAFSTLVDMYLKDLMMPSHSSTRPIYLALQRIPEEKRDDLCLELYEYLLNQHSMVGRLVPIQAVNVLLESCQYPQSAYDMYHNIRMVCRLGPDPATFHHLFSFTIQENDARRALKLANEHRKMKLRPDIVVYDGLIISLIQGRHNMDEIMDFYDEMRTVFERPMFRTMRAVYIALRSRNDPRAPEVFAQILRREGARGRSELSPRLQKLRIDAAAQTKKEKEASGSSAAPVIHFPPHRASELQGHIEEVQEIVRSGIIPEHVQISRPVRGQPVF